METLKTLRPPHSQGGDSGRGQNEFGLNIGEYFDGKFSFCENCHTYVPISKIREVNAGNSERLCFCSECCNDQCFYCNNCGKYFLRSQYECIMDVHGIGDLCRDCFEALDGFVCEYCEEAFVGDDYGYNGLCRFCDEDNDCDSSYPIRDYHCGLGLSFHQSKSAIDSNAPLYLGFELEAAGFDSPDKCDETAEYLLSEFSHNEDYFHLENDGSIPDYGFELISMPMTLDFHKKFNWEEIFKYMLDEGMRAHDIGKNVGLHVHFNRNFLTPVEMAKLEFYISLNKRKFECIARREENRWAGFKVPNGTISHFGKSSDECRYAAVNFTNRNTIEIRIFRSSLRYKTVIATLEIVDALVRFVKTLRAVNLLGCKHACWHLYEAYLKDHGERYAFALEYLSERRVIGETVEERRAHVCSFA